MPLHLFQPAGLLALIILIGWAGTVFFGLMPHELGFMLGGLQMGPRGRGGSGKYAFHYYSDDKSVWVVLHSVRLALLASAFWLWALINSIGGGFLDGGIISLGLVLIAAFHTTAITLPQCCEWWKSIAPPACASASAQRAMVTGSCLVVAVNYFIAVFISDHGLLTLYHLCGMGLWIGVAIKGYVLWNELESGGWTPQPRYNMVGQTDPEHETSLREETA